MITLRNINIIECFLLVAKYNSFSEAAKRLNISKNSMSRNIKNFEEKLGEKLFRRSTRNVCLTQFGEEFKIKCDHFWTSLMKLESEASKASLEPTGVLRIHASGTFSKDFLYKPLKKCREKYPKISLEIELSDSGADTWNLDKRKIDILFAFPHVSGITDDWKHKHLGTVLNILVISPKLLKKTNGVKTETDLLKIPFINHISRQPQNTIPLKNGKILNIQGPVISTNNFKYMKDMCLEGLGATLISENMVKKELKSGKLLSLLPNLAYKEHKLYAFYRATENSSKKVRAFIDLI